MIVIDASVVVAALTDSGETGSWADDQLLRGRLFAPQLLHVEAANILRKAALHGHLSADSAALAHQDLLALPFTLLPYAPFAERVWELRSTVTAYDAWYVAVAEELEAPLASLDGRLAAAPGPRCQFALPLGA